MRISVYIMESIIDWSQTIILLLVFILALYCTHLLRRIDEGLDCIHGAIHFIGDVFEEEIVFDGGDADDGEETPAPHKEWDEADS